MGAPFLPRFLRQKWGICGPRRYRFGKTSSDFQPRITDESGVVEIASEHALEPETLQRNQRPALHHIQLLRTRTHPYTRTSRSAPRSTRGNARSIPVRCSGIRSHARTCALIDFRTGARESINSNPSNKAVLRSKTVQRWVPHFSRAVCARSGVFDAEINRTTSG